ncbi:MAG: class I SAM-dependent methyltransferase [Candidatus Acidiferrum sp.]
MPANATEWDLKHAAASQNAPPEPASIVREMLPLFPAGPALDLACGTGRHTLLLAGRHQPVTAVDWSQTALTILAQRARGLHYHVHPVITPEVAAPSSTRGIWLVNADLDLAVLPANSFSLILCVQYLQRTLFPQIERALNPGGVLLFETFTRAQLEFADGPRNPAYLLAPGELREAFPELEVLFYRELRAGQGIASLVARKPIK